jgi:heparin/heparan-sulfate lyase
VIRAFHTTPDFTYIASDATACYHPDKCREAVRQFVHLQPNRFVVFDRVTTVRPGQPVTWILHTAREPAIEGVCFRADAGDGRLWCRTLLPQAAALRSVGGPGKEFWSDGRNWPLPDHPGLGGEEIRRPELLGGWRVEVSPSGPSTSVRFLHVLEAVDAQAATNMVAARLLGGGSWTGVEIREAGRTATVNFAQNGEIGCEIRMSKGTTNVAANLLNTIQAQSEWEIVKTFWIPHSSCSYAKSLDSPRHSPPRPAGSRASASRNASSSRFRGSQ